MAMEKSDHVARQNTLIDSLQSTRDRNVFIMMRYGRSEHFRLIEQTIRLALEPYGLIGHLAKDRALSDNLWDNVCLYMEASRYGIAVFEEIEHREFNPNVSLELGYMYALQRTCLPLKDVRMPRLPTDICGKIYRDFDTYDIPRSVAAEINAWCERDLGLTGLKRGIERRRTARGENEQLLYDSVRDVRFAGWSTYDTTRMHTQHVRIVELPDSATPGVKRVLEISADSTESVGISRPVDCLCGRFVAEYRVLSSASPVQNILLCAIPMQQDLDDSAPVEVGGSRYGEERNALSPYRRREFMEKTETSDGEWKRLMLRFDFRGTAGTAYTMCCVRINEGCPKPAAAKLQIRRLQILGVVGT